jgi:hypothetical protein
MSQTIVEKQDVNNAAMCIVDLIILVKIYIKVKSRDIINPVLKSIIDILLNIPELTQSNVYNKLFNELKTNQKLAKLVWKLSNDNCELKRQMILEIDRLLK